MGPERMAVSTTEQDNRRSGLEGQIRSHHGVSLDQVLEVIDYLREDGDSVLAGGSLAYGLGNGRSDLDIVMAGPATQESSSRMPLEHFVESLRVDVWKLRQDEIDELFLRARQLVVDEQPMAGVFGTVLEQADLKLLHRIAHGIVLDGPPLVPGEVRDYRNVARDVIVREYAERMRGSLYVAQLALAAGDWIGAAVNARFGVEEALQAVLAARSLPFSDNKWLQVRLAGDAPDLRPVYRPFSVLPHAPSGVSAFVDGAVRCAEELTGVELRAVALVSCARWQNTDLRLHRAGPVRLLMSSSQGVVWELDERDVESWESLEVQDGSWACEACSGAQMELCFELYRQGALQLEWTRGLPVAELGIRGEES